MKQFVIDASVIVKWVLQEEKTEADVTKALALLQDFRSKKINIVQPIHWLVEVAAVFVRLIPETAQQAVQLLHAMEIPIVDTAEVYLQACNLAHEHDHHLFDTFYHAVALSVPNTQLVTADEHYYRKVSKDDTVILLKNYPIMDK